MSTNLRLSEIPDADLLQSGEIMVVSLPDDITAFTTFDSTITPTYPVQIQDAVNLVKSVHTDDVIVQEQAEYTLQLNQARENCTSAYQTITYFALKAFANNPAVQKKFGIGNLKNIVHNQNKFIRYMEELVDLANEYSAALIAAGCNAEAINNLPVLAAALKTADRNQEKFKKDRGVLTQDRVGYLNALYKLLVPIDAGAQIIFRNDSARLAKYSLPRPAPPSPEKTIADSPTPDTQQ